MSYITQNKRINSRQSLRSLVAGVAMVAENDANASSRCSVNGCLVFYSRALQLIDAYESSKSILHLKAAFAYFYKALDGCHLDCHSVAVRLAIAANLLKYTTDFSEAEMHLLKAVSILFLFLLGRMLFI